MSLGVSKADSTPKREARAAAMLGEEMVDVRGENEPTSAREPRRTGPPEWPAHDEGLTGKPERRYLTSQMGRRDKMPPSQEYVCS